LDNVTVLRRIRPPWPKNSATERKDVSELSATIQEHDHCAQASSNFEEITTTQLTGYTSNTDPSEKNNNIFGECRIKTSSIKTNYFRKS
jgi:hypothetical protein